MIAAGNFTALLKAFLQRREIWVSLLIMALLVFLFFNRGMNMVLTILIQIAIFAVITMSLNLEVGYTGIPQFGRVLAVIVGAFAVGAIPGRLLAMFMGLPWGASYATDTVNYQLVPQINQVLSESWLLSIGFLIFSLLIAAACGAGIGWLMSRPAIRLKEAYLGISMLAFGDFAMWVGHNWEPLVGGSTGVYVPDPFRVVQSIYDNRFQVVVIVIFVIAVLIYLFVNRLVKTPFGRTLMMIRDNEVAAAAAGKDIVKIRTQSLMVGAALAAVGGGLWVIYTCNTTAFGFSRLVFTFWPWAFMMLGGIGSNTGVVLGVALLQILRTMITVYRFQLFGFLIAYKIDPIHLEFMLLGVVIVVVVLFMPHGLVPPKVEPTLPEKTLQRVLAGTVTAKPGAGG